MAAMDERHKRVERVGRRFLRELDDLAVLDVDAATAAALVMVELLIERIGGETAIEVCDVDHAAVAMN